jgi:hypothetical protein
MGFSPLIRKVKAANLFDASSLHGSMLKAFQADGHRLASP